MVCKKCKSEKYQKQIQHPVTDLKIELLVKIVNKFKLYTIFATGSEFSSDCNKSNVSYEQQKSYISQFFGTVALTTQPRFYLFKFSNRNTKNTSGGCEMCLELTVGAPE